MSSGHEHAWSEFRRRHDMLDASHRGLQRSLIPHWLQEPKTLGDRIEASAYGETPPALIEAILDALEPAPGELFLDLGCGAGNVCAAAQGRGVRVLGIERNPELWRAARAFLSNRSSSKLELRCADFFETDWSEAEIAYTTSARFPKSVVSRLAQLCHQAPRLRAIACLGRPLPLTAPWVPERLSQQRVMWNPGETSLREPLFLYRRSL